MNPEARSGAALAALVELLTEQLAPRVAAELAAPLARQEPGPAELEPWRLLTLKDAAARLGRSERWVRERAKRGELPRVHLDGGALAFDLDDLREYARGRRVGGELGRRKP